MTTPAGTFTCSVWAYSKQAVTESAGYAFQQNFSDTVWMSPGLPFVKSSESSNGVYWVTLLNKIN